MEPKNPDLEIPTEEPGEFAKGEEVLEDGSVLIPDRRSPEAVLFGKLYYVWWRILEAMTGRGLPWQNSVYMPTEMDALPIYIVGKDGGFTRVPGRERKLYGGLEELQKDLDEWLAYYNGSRTHQGKRCKGRTPLQTFLDGKALAEERRIKPPAPTPRMGLVSSTSEAVGAAVDI